MTRAASVAVFGSLVVFVCACTPSAQRPAPSTPPQRIVTNAALARFAALPPSEGLPADPTQWTCGATDAPSPEAIKAYCDAHPARGTAVKDIPGISPLLRGLPSSLTDLAAKNAYDQAFSAFLNQGLYQKQGWWSDRIFRLTGPCGRRRLDAHRQPG